MAMRRLLAVEEQLASTNAKLDQVYDQLQFLSAQLAQFLPPQHLPPQQPTPQPTTPAIPT